MTFDYDRLLWDPFAEDFFKQQKHFDHVSKIDIVEYEPGQQPSKHIRQRIHVAMVVYWACDDMIDRDPHFAQ